MGRRRAHHPLNIFINTRLAGRLLKQASGAIEFRYDQSWLAWEHGDLPYAEGPKLLSESRVASLPSTEMRRLSAEMEKGNLTGWIGEFDDELHFRPDGYRYSAPIDLRFANTTDLPAGRYRVRVDPLLKSGRPDEFVILTAEPD